MDSDFTIMGKVAVGFLLTVATLFLDTCAVPITYNTLAVKTVKKDLSQQERPFIDTCLIPCDNTGTEPICGSDGITYTSEKELLCHQACGKNITVAYQGECDILSCELTCDTVGTKPVCGSDNKTYSSEEELICYRACEKNDLQVAYQGECNRIPIECKIPCDQCQDNPICATDGKTYGCPNALTCYQMCGKKIDIDYFGNCDLTEKIYSLPVSRI